MDQRPREGAGGTRGGVGAFLLGAAMTIAGGYLHLTSIHVVNGFGADCSEWEVSGSSVG